MREVVCAWCTRAVPRMGDAATAADGSDGLTTSHGLCATCAGESGVFEVEDLLDLAADELDALPLGAIVLDADGVVREFNRAEQRLSGLAPERVIGRHFFTRVAPCTNVADFGGRYAAMVRAGSTARETLDFVFRFAGGDRMVTVAITYDAGRRQGLLLISTME
jgi:photoactive yellow protein